MCVCVCEFLPLWHLGSWSRPRAEQLIIFRLERCRCNGLPLVPTRQCMPRWLQAQSQADVQLGLRRNQCGAPQAAQDMHLARRLVESSGLRSAAGLATKPCSSCAFWHATVPWPSSTYCGPRQSTPGLLALGNHCQGGALVCGLCAASLLNLPRASAADVTHAKHVATLPVGLTSWVRGLLHCRCSTNSTRPRQLSPAVACACPPRAQPPRVLESEGWYAGLTKSGTRALIAGGLPTPPSRLPGRCVPRIEGRVRRALQAALCSLGRESGAS